MLFIFYVFFAFFYMVVLKVNMGSFNGGWNWQTIYLDYPLKALFTFPIWYLVFRLGRHWKFWFRIAVTVALLPLWTKGWQETYYFILDVVFLQFYPENTYIHLEGSGRIWDIYIPSLFYCIQFGTFFAYEYHHRVGKVEKEKAESDRLALASELSALKAQLNPHFLYNSFNAISASVPPGQEETRELVARLSDMFRYQLRATREDLLPLGEELEFIEDYLALEQARFGDRLEVTIDVPAAERRALVPPLILQPLVENAVVHGVSPKLEGGSVTIFARIQGERLLLRVEDDGQGLNPEKLAASKGFGLVNTRRRLDLLDNHELRIDIPPGGGTILNIEMPLYEPTENSHHRRRSPGTAITA